MDDHVNASCKTNQWIYWIVYNESILSVKYEHVDERIKVFVISMCAEYYTDGVIMSIYL
jgi:hypothetical protein